jgi:hypothetical protein
MALQIIGTGLGRTGTMSLKLALEQLEHGPCHHMTEVFQNMDSVPLWIAAGAGKPDWDAIFGKYRSMVDYPGCKFWRELMAYYPEAKLIHTLRDPIEWFESTQATIFAPNSLALSVDGPFAPFFGMISSDFGGRLHERAFMVEYFQRHTEAVLESVPSDRLLVFEAARAWQPLCAFLGVPVPDTPFPQVNSRAEFQAQRRPAALANAAPEHPS